MLHTCQHQKNNSNPEDIQNDFKRVLRERATNHRQFYRHLSTVTTNDRLAGKLDKSFLRETTSATKINSKDNFLGNKSQPNMVELIAEEDSITCSTSSKSSKSPTHSSYSDKTTVNHQPTILNVGKIQFNNDGQSASLIYNDDTPMTSVVSTVETDEELLNQQSVKADLPSISSDIFNNDIIVDPTPKYLVDCANPQCPPPLNCGSSALSSSTPAGGCTNFVNATFSVDSHDDDIIIIGSVSAVDDDTDVARNHFTDNDDDKLNDNKSRESLLSTAVSTQLPLSTSSSAIETAINNNNITCKQHDRNHSNYLTFVREASLNDCSSTRFHDKCRNCDKIWCSFAKSECDKGEIIQKEEEVKEKISSKDTCVNSRNLGSGLCLGKIIEKFESGIASFDNESKTGKNLNFVNWSTCSECKSNNQEDLKRSSSHDNLSITDDNSKNLHSLSLLIDSAVREGHFEFHQSFSESQKGVPYQQYYNFPCVDKLVKMYTKLLQDKKTEVKSSESLTAGKVRASGNRGGDSPVSCDTKLIEGLQIKDDRAADMNRNSPISDEGCQMASSPFSSDLEDNDSSGASEKSKGKEKVLRSSSSDSALDLDDEPPMEPPPNMNTGRRLTLTVNDIPLRAALLPVAEPNTLPDSKVDPTPSPPAPQTNVPSKVILEERIVEIPEDKFASNSRRESAQSTLSDFNPIEYGAVRVVRTPSVVVSDYSDDILCGVTLEEIEYFRAHRMRRRSSTDSHHAGRDDAASDVSAASSCSNLDYCGSTISGLDGNEYYMNGERILINRKISDCSTCSIVSGDDDDVENSNSSAVAGEVGSAFILQDNEDITDEQLQQKETELQRLAKERKKIQVKARHPKFIN